jgi:hypothetical protein
MSTLLEQASLVMIPSGYKEDVVYSQIPTDGSGDLSFTRASNGTRINSAGLVEVCPWNLVQNSEQYNAGTWTLAYLSISTNSGIAPNGTTTADLLYPSSSQAYCYASTTSISVVAGQIYTQSVYFKSSGFRWGIVDNMAGSPGAWFDLLNGVVGNVTSGCTASIENIGNGWYRCSVSSVAQSGTNYADFRMSDANGGGAVTANGTDGLLAWGFQLNIGSTAKPYFPTTDRLNVPRLTYQNGGGGCPSLLLEKQSTNYCLWSNDLTQSSAWINQTNNTTITQITSGGPDGGAFTRIVSTSSGSQGRIVQAGSITNPNGATMSVYLKGSGDTAFGLFIGNGISQYENVTLTNTWTRYDVTANGVGGTYQDWQINCVGGSTIDVSFVQVEEGVYATSPIPTTSSSATRVADECAKSGIGALIGGTSGTVFFDITTNPVLTSANYKQFFYYTDSSANQGYMYLNSGNGIITNPPFGNLSSSITLSANTRYKVALVYAPNDFALYVNGVSVATASSGTPWNFENLLSIGSYVGASEFNEFKFNQYLHFPTCLSNAELASLTTI